MPQRLGASIWRARLLLLSHLPYALVFLGALCVAAELRGCMPNRPVMPLCRRSTCWIAGPVE